VLSSVGHLGNSLPHPVSYPYPNTNVKANPNPNVNANPNPNVKANPNPNVNANPNPNPVGHLVTFASQYSLCYRRRRHSRLLQVSRRARPLMAVCVHSTFTRRKL